MKWHLLQCIPSTVCFNNIDNSVMYFKAAAAIY